MRKLIQEARVPAVLDAEHLRALGPRAALDVLMTAYQATIRAQCTRILRDRALAEDVSQQVFEEAFRDLPTFRGASSVRSWLGAIAAHRCLDEVRRARRLERNGWRCVETVEASPDWADPSSWTDRSQHRILLQAALAHVDPDVRSLIVMRYGDDMTYRQMGRLLGEKAGTIQVRVARALARLRRVLRSYLEPRRMRLSAPWGRRGGAPGTAPRA